MATIDYSRRAELPQKFSKDVLMAELDGMDAVNKKRIESQLSGEAQFDVLTLMRANQLLTHLQNEGHVYEVEPRYDGKGLLAKIGGVGGSRVSVTVAVADKSPKDRNAWHKVGNISMNGRNYSAQYNRYRADFLAENPGAVPPPESMLNGLTGRTKLVVRESTSKSTGYDLAFDTQAVDSNGVPLVDGKTSGPLKFSMFRRRLSDPALTPEEALEAAAALELDEDMAVSSTKLDALIAETQRRIEAEQDEEGLLHFDRGGLVEAVNAEELRFEVSEDGVYTGLNLDTMLEFHDRRDVARALAEEMRRNPDFNLGNPGIVGEVGLKNILTEQLAGIRAERVDAAELGDGYAEILQETQQMLEHSGVIVDDIGFDSDHVIHYEGVYADAKRERQDDKPVKGQIGQVFLPKDNVIETKFNVLEGEEDRNYALVPGYEAYIRSGDTPVKVPEHVVLPDADGIRRQYVKAAGEDAPFKYPRKVNGEYEYHMIELEKMTPSWVERAEAAVAAHNREMPDAQIPKLAYNERPPEYLDRVRVRGYDQQLRKNIQAVIAKHTLLRDTDILDGSSLNKLYHGEIYGVRITEAQRERPGVVETLSNRVRFPDEVMQYNEAVMGVPEKRDKDGNIMKDKYGNPLYDKTTHRANLVQFEGVFDPALSSDGQALGMIRYFVEDTAINKQTGEIRKAQDGKFKRAAIFKHMPYTHSDPGDRALMSGNQYIRARAIEPSNVALMTYRGYTFEDGSVVTKAYAERIGEQVNGRDDDGNIKPLQVGDKISDLHGNKSTISYIADPDDPKDAFFKENPDVEVVMSPYSMASRMNAGLVHEMQHSASGLNKQLTLNGKDIPNARVGELNIVITDITAEGKTQTYENEYDEGKLVKAASRKGRSFGVQEAWVARALQLDGVMDEVYGGNMRAYSEMKAYLNVTGVDIDETGVIHKGQGMPNESDYVFPDAQLSLPKDAAMMALPVQVDLMSGAPSSQVYVLEEKYRRSHQMYDGRRTIHDYTGDYKRINDAALDFIETVEGFRDDGKLDAVEDVDLSEVNLQDPADFERVMQALSDEKDRKALEEARAAIQLRVDRLSNRVIDDKLGGRMVEDPENGRRYKDTARSKRSIMRKEVMGTQVPNSVTAVVTADPALDLNTLRVSADIYDKMALEYDDDRVLMWRDPALHDGSMASFKIEKDEQMVGIGINPLVTEAFGMDFDGDTVGQYAPKTRDAQRELEQKAAVEYRLIDPTSEQFSGNVSQDFVSGAIQAGYVGEFPTKGPLAGERYDLSEKNEADQLKELLTTLAQQEDKEAAWQSVNDIWRDSVYSEHNIGAAAIDFTDRDTFRDSLMVIAKTGAKGNPKGIESDIEAQIREQHPEMSYAERAARARQQRQGKLQDDQAYVSEKPTVMTYYDLGEDYAEQLKKAGPNFAQDTEARRNLAYYNNSYLIGQGKSGARYLEPNKESLAHFYGNTRKAQGGKVDLTGLAGAKSQTLVGIMYEDAEGVMAAMEVTEPLTQATLKLKQDPSLEPIIQSSLREYDKIIREDKQDRQTFKRRFNDMYDAVGLSVNEKHLDAVYDTLSEPTANPVRVRVPASPDEKWDKALETVSTDPDVQADIKTRMAASPEGVGRLTFIEAAKEAAQARAAEIDDVRANNAYSALLEAQDGPRQTVNFEVKERHMSPLMQANLNGYDAFLDAASANDALQQARIEKRDPQYGQFARINDGASSKRHVPKHYADISYSNVTKATLESIETSRAHDTVAHQSDYDAVTFEQNVDFAKQQERERQAEYDTAPTKAAYKAAEEDAQIEFEAEALIREQRAAKRAKAARQPAQSKGFGLEM